MTARNNQIMLAIIGLSIVGMLGLKIMSKPKLRYFSPSEFGVWWLLMSNDLLIKLDDFRHIWGLPVMISPAQGSIGREDNSTSQHNVSKWGEVKATDILPQGMISKQDRMRAVEIAKEVGFTGIGIYPDWQPSAGLHLDVREGNLATWSGIKIAGSQQYFNIERGFV